MGWGRGAIKTDYMCVKVEGETNLPNTKFNYGGGNQ